MNRFIVMGTGHFDHLVGDYLTHYNTERPHSRIGGRVPGWEALPFRLSGRDGEVKFRTRLGGVLRCHEKAVG